jgi:hypothetical protein
VSREEAAAYIAGLTDAQWEELDRLLFRPEPDDREETLAILKRAGLI